MCLLKKFKNTKKFPREKPFQYKEREEAYERLSEMIYYVEFLNKTKSILKDVRGFNEAANSVSNTHNLGPILAKIKEQTEEMKKEFFDVGKKNDKIKFLVNIANGIGIMSLAQELRNNNSKTRELNNKILKKNKLNKQHRKTQKNNFSMGMGY